MKKYLPPIITILAFCLEWYLLDYLMVLVNSGTATTFKISVVLLIPAVLWAIVGYNFFQSQREKRLETGKASHLPFLLPFIRIFKAEVVTVNGVVSVLFILFNLAWTQDLLLEAIKGDIPWYYPVFTFLSLACPLVWPKTPRGKDKRVPVENRKVLITGIGLSDGSSEMSEEYKGWVKTWEPIRACFERYPNLERILILHSDRTITLSKEVVKLMDKGFNSKNPPEQNIPIQDFDDLLKKTISQKLAVEEKLLTNVNDYNVFFPELRKIINCFIEKHGYQDEEIISSVTVGTSMMTAGLTILSMPGKRGCVYSSQERGSALTRLTEFEVDIYTIDELWKEIIELSNGE